MNKQGLGTTEVVFETDDVVFAKVVTVLNLDQDEIFTTLVSHSVIRFLRDID
jgi:tRNA-binding EMAP/Myf-like protein